MGWAAGKMQGGLMELMGITVLVLCTQHISIHAPFLSALCTAVLSQHPCHAGFGGPWELDRAGKLSPVLHGRAQTFPSLSSLCSSV